ncbi:hypothetical protein R3P38DRAFT_518909 [Favolaschia claudopus]|uniref:DUF6534 domain-containing protein n=1 Tax=Favolaschia claudopus TaxID=2862362 RepID=A0AAV9ZD45_9AGAR
MSGSGVELLFGPLLLGLILSTGAYGVMCVQMLLYYQSFKRDARWIRYFILYLLFAETVNLLFEIGIVYEPLIVRYGQCQICVFPPTFPHDHPGSQRALIVSPLLIPGDAISIVAVSTPVQIFTAWRISVITNSIIFPLIITVLSVVSFGGGLFVSIFAAIRNEFREFQSFAPTVILWLVTSAVCDFLITIILTYSLTTRKTGFTAVDGQINRIIRLTVQTGAITAAAALADVILFLAFPGSTLNFIPDFPLSKLYTISLLSTLNARTRGRTTDAEERMPNALFNDSTAQKSMTNTTRNSILHPISTNVHVYPNTYQSPNGTIVGSVGRPFEEPKLEDSIQSPLRYPYHPSHSRQTSTTEISSVPPGVPPKPGNPIRF